MGSAAEAKRARDTYALDNAFRPACRGQLFGFFYTSGLWVLISAVYLGYYIYSGECTRFLDLFYRSLFCYTVFCKLRASHRLHNSDKVCHGTTRREMLATELAAHREDALCISMAMTTAFYINASKMRYPGTMFVGAALQAGASAVTAILMFHYFDDSMLTLPLKHRRHRFVVLDRLRVVILVFQFLVVKGYFFVWYLLTDDTEIGQLFRRATVIWFVYAIGMVAYILKPFSFGWDFGGHEVFHVFVMAGHCMNLVVDLLL